MREIPPLIERHLVRDNRAAGATETTGSIFDKGTLLPTPFTTMRVGQFGILVGREVARLQAD